MLLLERELRISMQPDQPVIVVDGRVFSTDAHDRGMGRYVRFLIQTLALAGYDICLILYKNTHLAKKDPLRSSIKTITHIHLDLTSCNAQHPHVCSHAIETIIRDNRAIAFIDATPFLLPMRLDITECPVVAVAYDLIPLKHPQEYLHTNTISAQIYQNALRRLANADCLIAISRYSKDAVSHYLGVEKEKIEVIYPCLDDHYLNAPLSKKRTKDYFSIVGGHFSKNPEFALGLFGKLNAYRKLDYTLCVPTKSQLRALKFQFPHLTKGLSIQASLSEKKKFCHQAESKIAFHLSRDEGFGIPLLEALFQETRTICCDIPVNREILEKCGDYKGKIALLLSSYLEENTIREISDFIDLSASEENESLFKNARDYFISHWTKEAPDLIRAVIAKASENHAVFFQGIVAKMVCNTPAHFCGVADYAYSIPRGAKKNMLIYTADTSIKKIDALPGVRIKTHLSFPEDLNGAVPTIFHLAVSEKLWFGIELMRLYGSSKDVAIIHDHTYLYGLYHLHFFSKTLRKFLDAYFVDSDVSLRAQIQTAKYMNFEEFNAALKGYRSAWLGRTNIRLISHLTETAQREYEHLSSMSLPLNKQYVPIGIDDKASIAALRIAKRWRSQRGISHSDLLVGVFGSVTNNKYICEISSAVSQASKEFTHLSQGNGKIHLILCGIVHDRSVFDQAKLHFDTLGLNAFFHYENSLNDEAFDGMMSAADLIISCRKQDRGQLSHIVPRALSLAKPLLTNSKSGYTMIREDCICDDHSFETSLKEKLCHFALHREDLMSLSHFNRNLFLENHNTADYLGKILTKN